MLLNNKETLRLRFRNLTLADIEAWMAFASDPLAVKYFPPVENVEDFSRMWIERQIARYENNGYGLYALIEKNTGEFIGQCGIMLQETDGKQYKEVGYHLFPKYWKKGYASEAATFCRDEAFKNNLELDNRIVSLIHPENFNSQAVAKRNGMTRCEMTKWKGIPHVVFAITRDEWNELNKSTSHS
jgi:[ribosomal protein S5]-alanine N-acetyltransferase